MLRFWILTGDMLYVVMSCFMLSLGPTRLLIELLLKQPYMDAEANAFDQCPDDNHCPMRSHLHPV